MPRISLSPPEKILSVTRIDVQIGDINYGGHLSNDAVLRLCHEARLRWLAPLGFSETDAGGAGLIMADAAVRYLAQAYRGDTLHIETGVSEIGKGGFTLSYRLVREQDGQTVALVQTGMVCFDYGRQRVCRLPQVLKTALEAV